MKFWRIVTPGCKICINMNTYVQLAKDGYVKPGNIVIVGAGPVGLTAALRLGSFGIPCTLIEREAELPEDLRASTFHPPTLDFLDEYGIAEPLIAQGLICPDWQVRIHETGEHVRFDLSLLKDDSAHPYRLQCEQYRLCRLLLDRLRTMPEVTVMLGAAVTGIDQDADKVTVTFEKDGAAGRVEASILIGADGARSTVREAIGLELKGETYPETTILATTSFCFEKHMPDLSNVNYVWTGAGTYSLLRLPAFWRCSLYPDADETIEDGLKPESIERKLQRIVPRDEPYEVMEVRQYRVHMRIVDDFRVGRVVLAGDAAHINSPSGGMGMNGGVHDAFNLTATIREMIETGAGPEALDRYTRQRRPIVAADILGQANRNRARMQERDPERRRRLFAELQGLAADRGRMYERLLESSMIAGLRRSREIA